MAVTGAMMALGAISGLVKKRKAKKAAKKMQKAQQQQAAYYQQFASPENYAKLVNQYRGQFQEGYTPALRQLGDTLALNESHGQQAFAADTARRGLSGSGLAFAGQNSLRAARMAGLGEGQRAFQMDVENAARQQASQTIGNQLAGAQQFNPYQYVPQAPSTLEALLSGASQGIGMAGQYGALTGSSGNLGSLLGLKGGPGSVAPGDYGPAAPYYYGQQPGRG